MTVKPKYQNYRVCYENGNRLTGEKIYELYKYCKCEDCQRREQWSRTPANKVTASTRDISKVDEIAEFLSNWNCEDGTKSLDILYLKF